MNYDTVLPNLRSDLLPQLFTYKRIALLTSQEYEHIYALLKRI